MYMMNWGIQFRGFFPRRWATCHHTRYPTLIGHVLKLNFKSCTLAF